MYLDGQDLQAVIQLRLKLRVRPLAKRLLGPACLRVLGDQAQDRLKDFCPRRATRGAVEVLLHQERGEPAGAPEVLHEALQHLAAVRDGLSAAPGGFRELRDRPALDVQKGIGPVLLALPEQPLAAALKAARVQGAVLLALEVIVRVRVGLPAVDARPLNWSAHVSPFADRCTCDQYSAPKREGAHSLIQTARAPLVAPPTRPAQKPAFVRTRIRPEVVALVSMAKPSCALAP